MGTDDNAGRSEPTHGYNPPAAGSGVPSSGALDGGDLAATRSPERTAELDLARACAAGDSLALRALEAEFFDEVRACYARLRPADLGVDELEQRVRDKLFVRGAIARFSGKGDLRRWLRVLTTRLIVDHVRARRPALPLEDELLPDTHGAGADTALAKDQLRVQVRGALRRAFAALSDRQQLLLRAELHGTTLAALAATYQVHVRSMQRWVREAHQVLLGELRRVLAEQLRVAPRELSSILAFARSQLLSGLAEVVQDGAQPERRSS